MAKDDNELFLVTLIVLIGAVTLIISFLIILVMSYSKIMKQRKLHHQLELDHQKKLTLAILASEEKERQRIGMDLHDEVGSPLSLIRILISTVYTSKTESYFDQCRRLIDHTIQSVRNITHNLSPFVGGVYTFIDALEDFCQSVRDAGAIDLQIQNAVKDDFFVHLESHVSLTWYRVLTELINNTIKHSHANQVVIRLAIQLNVFVIEYEDNGDGLPVVAQVSKGNGLRNIKNRLDAIGATYFILEGGAGFYFKMEWNKHQI